MLQGFPDLQLHPRNLAADDRVALLEARLTGTNTGPFPLSETDRLVLGTQAETLPATGRAMDITGAVVLEVADGQVTAERHYWPLVELSCSWASSDDHGLLCGLFVRRPHGNPRSSARADWQQRHLGATRRRVAQRLAR